VDQWPSSTPKVSPPSPKRNQGHHFKAERSTLLTNFLASDLASKSEPQQKQQKIPSCSLRKITPLQASFAFIGAYQTTHGENQTPSLLKDKHSTLVQLESGANFELAVLTCLQHFNSV
jgi:hypothetical protein